MTKLEDTLWAAATHWADQSNSLFVEHARATAEAWKVMRAEGVPYALAAYQLFKLINTKQWFAEPAIVEEEPEIDGLEFLNTLFGAIEDGPDIDFNTNGEDEDPDPYDDEDPRNWF